MKRELIYDILRLALVGGAGDYGALEEPYTGAP